MCRQNATFFKSNMERLRAAITEGGQYPGGATTKVISVVICKGEVHNEHVPPHLQAERILFDAHDHDPSLAAMSLAQRRLHNKQWASRVVHEYEGGPFRAVSGAQVGVQSGCPSLRVQTVVSARRFERKTLPC